MELVKQTQYWIENIEHRVLFDSWNQFLVVGEGLRAHWSSFSLLTWGCKEEREGFLLQIIYIDLYGKKEPDRKPIVFGKHMFELKSVEISIKESDIQAICKWLEKNNSDLWKMNYLTGKVEELTDN